MEQSCHSLQHITFWILFFLINPHFLQRIVNIFSVVGNIYLTKERFSFFFWSMILFNVPSQACYISINHTTYYTMQFHFDTAPHDLQVENPLLCPSFCPYVHLNPSALPHFLHLSLNSIAGGSPKVGVILNLLYLPH